MSATKILFLDLDGVINSKRTAVAFDGYPHSFSDSDMKRFDHVAIALIRKLCEETDCSIVLSSSWRINSTAHETANALDLPIIDITPVLTVSRGFEINAWLSEHPQVTRFAIVDDIAEMLGDQENNFVQTDDEVGLSLRDYLDLKQILSPISMLEDAA